MTLSLRGVLFCALLLAHVGFAFDNTWTLQSQQQLSFQ